MVRRIAIVLMLAFLSSGCAIKAYEGPELPRSEIAVLHNGYAHGVVLGLLIVVPVPEKKHLTVIDEIDGKKRGVGREIHILPGQHTARVWYTRYPDVTFCGVIVLIPACIPNYETRDLSIGFTAKAGHEYRIPAERRGERNWIWVEDITESKANGKVVVEVVAGEKPPDVKAKGKDPARPSDKPKSEPGS